MPPQSEGPGAWGQLRAPTVITSRDNRWLKRFRAALAGASSRAGVGEDGAEVVGVEGARIVETALRSGVPITALLVSDSGARHLAKLSPWIPDDTPLFSVADALFSSVAGTEAPQGVAALVTPRAVAIEDLIAPRVPLILVLAGLQDPGNVGTLVRAAEAFGASGVAACGASGIGTANPFGPKALRASAGSALRLPVLRGGPAADLIEQLRGAGVRIRAACPEDSPARGAGEQEPHRKSVLPWEADWRIPSAVLIGNEGAGLPAELGRLADDIVRIPQAAAASSGAPMDSLNAAIAGAVLLYESARQRGFT